MFETSLKHNAAGEIALDVDGTTYLLRPTLRCAMDVEKALGRALTVLLKDFAADKISLTDAYTIVNLAAIAGGQKSGIPDSAYQIGAMRLQLVAAHVVNLLATGGKVGEAKEATGP